MFEENKIYWFVIKGTTKAQITFKGKVIEEDDYIVKIERDNGDITFIPKQQIIQVNENKERV